MTTEKTTLQAAIERMAREDGTWGSAKPATRKARPTCQAGIVALNSVQDTEDARCPIHGRNCPEIVAAR